MTLTKAGLWTYFSQRWSQPVCLSHFETSYARLNTTYASSEKEMVAGNTDLYLKNGNFFCP